ncbi:MULTISPECIES: glycosyltransferase family A protein [Croceibacter]|uniref:glycosyltransferase family A protein n=1 Tax=Croceibacter TaxID=216431 RepID=UPI002355CC5C|nr:MULTISPECIES: glycosyltransferase family A protein [Croceibacter]|tara:strand:+ start:2045 stop:2917 length:873 start_codon:yes stop_codon:yes gene_type:complete
MRNDKLENLITIVVPCYNQGHFLDEALQSVEKQSYKNLECIIVNDGSEDDTEIVANIWVQKDNRFKYISKENGGLSSARNLGISKSQGNFILPLDSDDILHESLLELLLPVLLHNSKIGIVSCYAKYFRKNIHDVFYKLEPVGNTYNDIMFENRMMATSLYRKQCWEEAGGYDENMTNGFEDWEFWVNVTKRGWTFEFVKKHLFFYRKSKDSMLTNTLKHHVEDNMEYIYKKHKTIYIKHFDETIFYFMFLIRRYKSSEIKLKNSLEYKLGKVLLKPWNILTKLVGEKFI